MFFSWLKYTTVYQISLFFLNEVEAFVYLLIDFVMCYHKTYLPRSTVIDTK